MPGEKFEFEDVARFEMFGKKREWRHNKDVLTIVLEQMATDHPERFDEIISELRSHMRFSKQPSAIKWSKKIRGTDWWCDTNLPTKRIIERARLVFRSFGHPGLELVIETRKRAKHDS